MKCKILLFLITLNYSLLFGQNSKVDSLEKLADKTEVDTIKVNLLNEIAFQLRNINPVKAQKFAYKALRLAEKENYSFGLAESYGYLGLLYYRLGDFDKAVENHLKSLKISQEINNKRFISFRFNDIANVYLEQGYLKQAIEYYQKSIEIKTQLKDLEGIANTYGNIGSAYIKQADYPKAQEHILQAIEIAEKYQLKRILSINYGNLGEVFLFQKNYQRAIENFEKGLKVSREIDNQTMECEILYFLGVLYYEKKEFNKALDYLQIALLSSKKASLKPMQLRIYTALADLFVQRLQPDKGFEYLKKATILKDSIYTKESNEKLAQMQAKFNSERNLLEIQNLQQQNRQQKIYLYSVIAGIFFLLLLVSFLIYSNYQRTVANRILTQQKNLLKEKNEEINQQNEEISTQAEELQQANARLMELDTFKEGMVAMIVHDLKNPLNTILGLSDEKSEIQLAGKQMLNMVLNILDVQKLENTQLKIQSFDFKLSEVARQAIDEVKALVERKNITLENQISSSVLVKIDFELIKRVLVNLLTNAIKFTPNNGNIWLSATMEDNEVKVSVKDNGKGIEESKLGKIFEKFYQTEAREMGNVRSTGLGLSFCKIAVEAHQGSIWAESELGKGAEFLFTLPLIPQKNLSEVEVPDIYQSATYSAPSIQLTKDEKQNLSLFVQSLQQHTVYEYSDIKQILDEIPTYNNPNILIWKLQLENAFRSCNEERYQYLLHLV